MSGHASIIILFIFLFAFAITNYNCVDIRCRKCGNIIGDTNKLINQKTNKSLNSVKKLIFDKSVLHHTFKNPSNIYFEIFTLKEANLVCSNENIESYTFFPGYGWSMCVCPLCGEHHGWRFYPIEKYCKEGDINYKDDNLEIGKYKLDYKSDKDNNKDEVYMEELEVEYNSRTKNSKICKDMMPFYGLSTENVSSPNKSNFEEKIEL